MLSLNCVVRKPINLWLIVNYVKTCNNYIYVSSPFTFSSCFGIRWRWDKLCLPHGVIVKSNIDWRNMQWNFHQISQLEDKEDSVIHDCQLKSDCSPWARNGTLPTVIGIETWRSLTPGAPSFTVKTYENFKIRQLLMEGTVAGMGSNWLFQLNVAPGSIPGPVILWIIWLCTRRRPLA